MNIMYLTDVGFDTPNSNNHLVISMVEKFIEKGHSVYLVQSHSTGTYADIPDKLKECKNFTIDTIKREVVKRSNFVKRYLSAIQYEIKAEKQWKKCIKDMDVVILQSHYTAVYSAMLLRKYHKKIIFNIYDIFPGEAYTNGNIRSKFVYDFFSFIQKYLYKYCDAFFTLTEDTKRTLISLGVLESKIYIIPNWFDESAIHWVEFSNNRFAQKYGLKEEVKYIQYAGSIGVSYDFDLILDVAKLLEDRNDIVFQIVGEGLKLDEIKTRAEKKNLNNVQFIPWQPLELLSDMYSVSTIQIVPLRRDVIRNSYPSKILPLMACGRIPVVSVEKDSFFYSKLNNSNAGIAVSLGDANLLAQQIETLVDNPFQIREMEIKAKDYAYENYTANANTEKMLRAIEKIIGGQ